MTDQETAQTFSGRGGRARLRAAARDAEWTVPEGEIGRIVRQLRLRGAIAARRAKWIFAVLIAVIFLGLAFYLGLPFWQQFADGRKQTLDDQLEVLEAQQRALDTERGRILSTSGDDGADAEGDPGLVEALRGAPRVVGEGPGEPLSLPVAVDGALFVTMLSGTILRSTDGGASFDTVPERTGERLHPPVAVGGALIITGWHGAILRMDDIWSDRADELRIRLENALALDPEAPTDPDLLRENRLQADVALLAFLDEPLPEGVAPLVPVEESLPDDVGELEIVDGFDSRVRQLVARRESLSAIQADTQGRRDRFDRLPWALIARDETALRYERFVTLCRAGSTAPEVIQTCEESWRAQAAVANSSWWQTIAQQVPPGIILLFLLATLSVLYRYNMRLAGFHHSRADALLLHHAGVVPSRDMEGLERLMLATAADRVEFGGTKIGISGSTFETTSARSS